MIIRSKTLAGICAALLIFTLPVTACGQGTGTDREAIREEAKITAVEAMDALASIDQERFTSYTSEEFRQNEDFSSFFDKTKYYTVLLGDDKTYDKLNALVRQDLDEKLTVLMGKMIGEYEVKDVTLDSEGTTAVVEIQMNMKKLADTTYLSTQGKLAGDAYILANYDELQSDYILYGEDFVKIKIYNHCLPEVMDALIDDLDHDLLTTGEMHTIKLKLEKQDDGKFLITEGSFD